MSETGDPVKSPPTQRSRTENPRSPLDSTRPPPSRRRDKPQLSCKACRKRKVRCDRLQPCSNCASRGLSASCIYAPQPTLLAQGSTHIQDRINQLEGLILSLVQRTAPSSQTEATPPKSTNNFAFSTETNLDLSLDEKAERCPSEVPPSTFDYGSIRVRNSESSYVSSAHWAAVLDSISELRDHFEQEDEHRELTMYDAHPCTGFPSPQLFYTGVSTSTSVDSILEAIPPRLVVDRLISRHFNDLDMASGVPHSGKFLQEYEQFWKCPRETPIIWIGLLFSIMCLSTQVQHHFLDSTNTSPNRQNLQFQTSAQANIFREKITHCLILGHYTKGGPHILETLILYLMVEVFPSKDTTSGLRILVSTIVTIATQMGYHRDASHFPNISPFAGEMRRRVWALIVQLDFNISMQMGLARLIKENQSDVSEPRNLFDSDFDEDCTDLPPSRPETEVTPTLYTLAKIRLIVVGAKVVDAATEPRPFSYNAILELDAQIDKVQAALPSAMRWAGLACSLSTPAQILMKRIWIEICVHRSKIVLHKRFMLISESKDHSSIPGEYSYSRSTCLSAAMKILEVQHLVDEETQPDGRLYHSRWRLTASFIHDFLLATSLMCFYLQNHTGRNGMDDVQEVGTGAAYENNHVSLGKIKQLLRISQTIWLRESHTSQEARKAASALHYILGDPEIGPGCSRPTSAGLYFPGQFADMMSGCEFLNGLDLQFTNEELSWQRHASPLNTAAELGNESWHQLGL